MTQERATVTVLGGGARLIGGGAFGGTESRRSADVAGGRLSAAGSTSMNGPRAAVAAMVEFGLPYAADPAISRHLAAFLARHADASRRALGEPASAELSACPMRCY
jgi:hypothetical protein